MTLNNPGPGAAKGSTCLKPCERSAGTGVQLPSAPNPGIAVGSLPGKIIFSWGQLPGKAGPGTLGRCYERKLSMPLSRE